MLTTHLVRCSFRSGQGMKRIPLNKQISAKSRCARLPYVQQALRFDMRQPNDGNLQVCFPCSCLVLQQCAPKQEKGGTKAKKLGNCLMSRKCAIETAASMFCSAKNVSWMRLHCKSLTKGIRLHFSICECLIGQGPEYLPSPVRSSQIRTCQWGHLHVPLSPSYKIQNTNKIHHKTTVERLCSQLPNWTVLWQFVLQQDLKVYALNQRNTCERNWNVKFTITFGKTLQSIFVRRFAWPIYAEWNSSSK